MKVSTSTKDFLDFLVGGEMRVKLHKQHAPPYWTAICSDYAQIWNTEDLVKAYHTESLEN